MIEIRLATINDAAVLAAHDRHVSAGCIKQKISRQEIYAAYDGDVLVGWLRYSLFWDIVPFMNMLEILPAYRGKGLGKQLALFWETQMKEQGHNKVMTSTQQNENVQHFYLHMGYVTVGGFALAGDTYELMMEKQLDREELR